MAILSILIALVHPYHVSVCDITYDSVNQSYQITHRFYADDLEMSLEYFSRRQIDVYADSALLSKLIPQYLTNNFQLSQENEALVYGYLGYELEDDVVWCYLEVCNIPQPVGLEVRNKVFTTAFDDQQNILHFKLPNGKQSFILKKGNASAKYSR